MPPRHSREAVKQIWHLAGLASGRCPDFLLLRKWAASPGRSYQHPCQADRGHQDDEPREDPAPQPQSAPTGEVRTSSHVQGAMTTNALVQVAAESLYIR